MMVQRRPHGAIPALRGRLLHAVPMARHTVWGIGGPAREFFEPADREDLLNFLRARPRLDCFWLGLGSNLLVRDGGLERTVIHTAAAVDEIARTAELLVRVSSGVPCPKVARFCSRQALSGLEFFAGIPGTVGGALAMNAGAFGGETWDRVIRVWTVDAHGRVHERERCEFHAAYRSVLGPPGEWFLEAEFALSAGSADTTAARVKELLAKRAQTQPTGQRSCGSVFRNPPGDHAARLIDVSGLKGYRIGQAQVSPKHANFIINLGDAAAADVEALILHVQRTVHALHGVELQPEVLIVGEAAKA